MTAMGWIVVVGAVGAYALLWVAWWKGFQRVATRVERSKHLCAPPRSSQRDWSDGDHLLECRTWWRSSRGFRKQTPRRPTS